MKSSSSFAPVTVEEIGKGNDHNDRKRSWRKFLNLVLLSIIFSCYFAARAGALMVVPYGCAVMSGVSPFLYTFTLCLWFICDCFWVWPNGWLNKTLGYRLSFMISNVIGIAGFILAFYAMYSDQYWLFCLSTAVYSSIGMGEFARWAASDAVGPGEGPKAASRVVVGAAFGSAIGPLASAYAATLGDNPVTERQGYSFFFLFCAGFSVISTISAFFLDLPCDRGHKLSSFSALRRSKHVLENDAKKGRKEQVEDGGQSSPLEVEDVPMPLGAAAVAGQLAIDGSNATSGSALVTCATASNADADTPAVQGQGDCGGRGDVFNAQMNKGHVEQDRLVQEQCPTANHTQRWHLPALLHPQIAIGIIAQIAVQFNMTLIMTATPLAMETTISDLSKLLGSLVIIFHILGMFVPGLWTAYIIDQLGVFNTTLLGLGLQVFCQVILLVLTGSVIDDAFGYSSTTTSDVKYFAFFVSLVLLGVGWNYSYIAGTVFLKQNYRKEDANFIQTVNEFARFLATAIASLIAVFSQTNEQWNILLYIGLASIFAIVLLLFGLRIFLKDSFKEGKETETNTSAPEHQV